MLCLSQSTLKFTYTCWLLFLLKRLRCRTTDQSTCRQSYCIEPFTLSQHRMRNDHLRIPFYSSIPISISYMPSSNAS
ncbi:hypothetical protein V1507DRAFT_141886 [Lipomyces tetrasporus]